MKGRTAKISRKTKETDISLEVSLDGSGASTIETKSYWPSVVYWATTRAPSASTSRFTSATRPGLPLSVFTPSEVRLVSIT